MSTAVDPRPADRCVCVWFGRHKIVEHVAEPMTATRFEAACDAALAACGLPTSQ